MAEAEHAGVFTGMAIDTKDGYIHFSTAEQAAETAALHFQGQDGLLLIAVEGDQFGDALKWEVSRGGALFPHLFATLPSQLFSGPSRCPWVRTANTVCQS